MYRLITLCILAAACPALAQDAKFEMKSADGKIILKNFECKSDSLDKVEQEAVVLAVDKAAREELKAELTSKKPADKVKANQAILAAAKEAAEAIKGTSKLVKYDKVDGPRKRVGAPGYIIINTEVSSARIRELFQAATAEPLGTVMVVFAEEVQAAQVENTVNVRVAQDSKLAAAVEQELINNGYRVINGNQIKAIQDMKVDWAKLDGKDVKTIQGIATDQKADIFVTGFSKMVGPEVRRIEGINDPFYAWSCDATGRAFYSDNAEVISVMTTADVAKSDREALDRIRDAGAALAIEKASKILAGIFVKDMLTRGQGSSPTVTVTITGVKAAQSVALEDMFKEIAGKDNVNVRFSRGVMTAEVNGMSSRDLMKAMLKKTDALGDKDTLDIDSQTSRAISATVKAKDAAK